MKTLRTSLHQLKQTPDRDKTVLFIENKHDLHSDYSCEVITFAPALTGMATVRGAPYDYCPATDYGYY